MSTPRPITTAFAQENARILADAAGLAKGMINRMNKLLAAAEKGDLDEIEWVAKEAFPELAARARLVRALSPLSEI